MGFFFSCRETNYSSNCFAVPSHAGRQIFRVAHAARTPSESDSTLTTWRKHKATPGGKVRPPRERRQDATPDGATDRQTASRAEPGDRPGRRGQPTTNSRFEQNGTSPPPPPLPYFVFFCPPSKRALNRRGCSNHTHRRLRPSIRLIRARSFPSD